MEAGEDVIEHYLDAVIRRAPCDTPTKLYISEWCVGVHGISRGKCVYPWSSECEARSSTMNLWQGERALYAVHFL